MRRRALCVCALLRRVDQLVRTSMALLDGGEVGVCVGFARVMSHASDQSTGSTVVITDGRGVWCECVTREKPVQSVFPQLYVEHLVCVSPRCANSFPPPPGGSDNRVLPQLFHRYDLKLGQLLAAEACVTLLCLCMRARTCHRQIATKRT
ncbi:hypothetical protein BASA60_010117 [Batrachochytrium salamandrivorans]|nr:hypothetical protein BASA60_010117 [Batrachochytrium salamandrivorans]